MPIPRVNVAVAMIACGKKILAIHNPKWGAFSFPMTKLRKWKDPDMPLGASEEEWRAAATRTAAEVLGRTLARGEVPTPLHERVECRQNDADGIWKLYTLQVFKMPLARVPKSLGFGVVAEWLTARELQERAPVSITVRHLLKELEAIKRLPPWD